MALIACVPNISEGRREDVLHRLSEAITSVRGIRLLDRTTDAVLNRSVFTFVGRPAALRLAVAAMVEAAVVDIDLTKHSGRHPRMGAVDVIPFVPLHGTPMETAVRLARATGRDVAGRFGIPVYLYDHAARSDKRRSINDIREGEFEGFAAKIQLPAWKPDYGSARIHPTAGATGIGARFPLVAFNAVLDTPDLQAVESLVHSLHRKYPDPSGVKVVLAKQNGGSTVKISITIMRYREFPFHEVVETVIAGAEKRGIRYAGTELIGLVTGDVLYAGLEKFLRLVNFQPRQILDLHIGEGTF